VISPTSEFYAPTFQNTLYVPSSPPMKMEQIVPKRRYITFKRRGITQKKEYKSESAHAYVFERLYGIRFGAVWGEPTW